MSTSELKNHAGEGVDNLAVTTEDDTTAVLKSTDGLKMGKMDPNRFTSIPWSDNKTVNGGAYSRKSKGSVSKGSAVVHISVDDSETEAVKERLDAPLLYKISDTPPISVIIFLGFQQTVLTIAASLIIPMLVADACCARNDNAVVLKLITSNMLMNGITSFLQTVVGIRLPLFQGPAIAYVIPLLALRAVEPYRCSVSHTFADRITNTTTTEQMEDLQQDLVSLRIRELMGPLMICGFIQFLAGLVGLVGVLMRFIGPITIVPTLLLIGISSVEPVVSYAEVHWGITCFVWAISLILTLYLGHRAMPVPIYTRSKGFHIIRYPLHQVFAILITILLGWGLCGILTAAGVFTDDKTSKEYTARTDARTDVIDKTSWFYLPYPGQFGTPLFSISVFVAFVMGKITSILDSIGDYYACATICRVPPPPAHATNRGIAIEGFCSILAGIMGIGNGTSTIAGNIGAIGLTKVASRHVFVAMSIIYVIFGVVAKFTAVFMTIPDPVIGGIILTVLGVFVGVNLANLKVIDLSSSRNLSIIGMGIFVGLVVPAWLASNRLAIQTGNADADSFLKVLLGNPNFIGSVVACFLDNTVPGTAKERGIAAWMEDKDKDTLDDAGADYAEGSEVYDPLLPKKAMSWKIMKYLPIFPYKGDQTEPTLQLDRKPPCVDLTDWTVRRNSV